MSATRPYQVVVWGATGFTGKLVCEHLTQSYQGKVRWAMAGRNQAKLEMVRKELSALNAEVEKVPIIVADSHDAASMDHLTAQTQVVITTVGPYTQYGEKLVAASVKNQTHYCDLTAELPWMRKMMDKYHEEALRNRTKIVHSCGLDSIPSDLGTLLVVERLKDKGGIERVEALLGDAYGGVSGGTIASAFEIMNSSEATAMLDPYYLADGPRGPDSASWMLPRHSELAGGWTAPFVMEMSNSRVVRRSAGLLGYGADFAYDERARASSWIVAMLSSAGLFGFGAALKTPGLASLLRWMLPKPGEGPSKEVQQNGFWKFEVIGEGKPGVDGKRCRAVAKLSHNLDPGYASTARMLLECALVLADDEARDSPGTLPGGVLTPATALGLALAERLRAVPGFGLEVQDVPA